MSTSNEYREALQRLHDEAIRYAGDTGHQRDKYSQLWAAIDAAKALLARPEPVEPAAAEKAREPSSLECRDLLQVAFTGIKGGFNLPDWWLERTRKELNRSYDADRDAREAAQTQKTLRDFGYAPGNYMSNCLACGNSMTDVDKRCRKCKQCAEKQLQDWIDAQDLPSPPAATGETKP